MLLVVSHIYWNLQCISSHIYSGMLYLLRRREQTQAILKHIAFIAVVPVTVCKETWVSKCGNDCNLMLKPL